MNRDIAIIGMSGRFPDAKNIDELLENLKIGKDSIKELSSSRIEQMTISKDRAYKRCGYLDEVDKFDYRFFGISFTEAKAMCPEQRMLLETTYHAIENSGYSPEHFYGSNTAVIAAASSSNYYEHADEKPPTLYTGNAPEYLAGVLGRYFNLKGSAFVVDTSCSSSTTALHIACNELITGDADQVIVAGATTQLFPYDEENIGLNVESPDGRSRAFSNGANGMSRGEMVTALILKPLDKAIEDKDNVHAIIKGTAVVYNGNQSANIAAPDSGSQADTILKAWSKAGVTANDVSNIEVHGSGTKLGDSLEIEALNTVFKTFTDAVKCCPISSIKTNIGHTLSGSGLSGVTKMILALKNQYIFPSLHFDTPSELIDFDKASVYVNTELKKWETKNGVARIGGVTSSGASGTNGHIVLQEYKREVSNSTANATKYHIPVSAKTEQALQRNLEALSTFIKANPGVNLQHMSYTLTQGRMHYGYRNSYLVNSVSELESNINKDLEANKHYNLKTDNHKMVFVFSESNRTINEDLMTLLKNKYEVFKTQWEQCEAICKLETAALKQFAFQLSFYYLLESLELTTDNLLPLQLGNNIYDVINEEETLKEVLETIKSYASETLEDVEHKANQLVKNQSEDSDVTFIDFAGEGALHTYLTKYSTIENTVSYIGFKTDKVEDPIPQLIHLLYLRGYNATVNYTAISNTEGLKITLPTYQFEKDRCWLKETYIAGESENDIVSEPVKEEQTQLEQKLQIVVDSFLEDNINTVKEITESEQEQRFIEALNTLFYIELVDLEAVASFKELTELVTSKLTTASKVAIIWKAILGTKNLTLEDSFFDIGGHSIFATQITNLINDEFNINIAFDAIYEYETVGELAKHIDSILWLSNTEKDTSNYEVII